MNEPTSGWMERVKCYKVRSGERIEKKCASCIIHSLYRVKCGVYIFTVSYELCGTSNVCLTWITKKQTGWERVEKVYTR